MMASKFEDDPVYVQQLKTFFLLLPQNVERCSEVARIMIRRELFRAASCNGKYINLFFPDVQDQELLRQILHDELDDDWKPERESFKARRTSSGGSGANCDIDPTNWDWTLKPRSKDLKDDPYHPGRPCVRKFKRGEPTYRCLTCALDETCVLCKYCFNPEDHIDHQVTVSISQRDSGGVCDCGDPEAWTRTFPCRYYQIPGMAKEEIPVEAVESLSHTINACLDYMIDVFNQADIGVHRFKTPEQVDINHRLSKFSSEAYGQEDLSGGGKYVLCMWNDQKHSFSDALEAILHTTHKHADFGKMVTERVDSHGRAMVEISKDLPQMMLHKESMERTGLDNTVRYSVDFFREEMCECIAEWMDALSKIALNGNHEIIREKIGTSLLNPWKYGIDVLVRKDWRSNNQRSYGDGNQAYITWRSSLQGPYIPPIGSVAGLQYSSTYDSEEGGVPPAEPNEPRNIYSHEESGTDEDEDISGSIVPAVELLRNSDSSSDLFPPGFDAVAHQRFCDRHVTPLGGFWTDDTTHDPTKMSSRIQYLMFFDIRYWKNLRTILRDIFISVLMSTANYKKILGMQYAEIYPQLSELYMLADREPECSIISSMSTQLFTTPTVATDMIEHDVFTRFLAALYTFFTEGRFGPPSAVDSNSHVSSDPKVLKNHRFNQMFHDLEYILSRNGQPNLVSGSVVKVTQLCDFAMLFQGLSPLQRQKHTHVEFESDLWIYFFNTVPYVLQLGFAVAKGISCCSSAEAHGAISRVSRLISDWAQGAYNKRLVDSEMSDVSPKFKVVSCSYGGRRVSSAVVQFRVDEEKLSLHHPVHAFLSWMIQYGKVGSIDDLRRILLPDNYIAGAEIENWELIFDHPIRVLSLLSEIQVGLWVRNGYSVRNQLYHYRDLTLRDSAFFRDVFMVQTALVVLPPETAFLTLQDRWSLLKWRSDDIYDETQRMYLLEDFLHFLIAFVVERNYLRGLDEKEVKRRYIVKEIIQYLAVRDLSFSDVCKVIPDVLSGDEMFEAVLKDMATFKAPTGLRDHGTYQLNQELLYQFDTHYIHFSSANIEESESIVRGHIAKVAGIEVDEVVLEPPFEPIESGPYMNISGFTRTVSFAKFIFGILGFILESKSGTQYDGVISHILQLLHAAAIDDLNVAKTLGIPILESFCYLMCSASDSEDYSKSIVGLLDELRINADFKVHSAKIARILELLKQRDEEMVKESLKRADSARSVIFSEVNSGTTSAKEGSVGVDSEDGDEETEASRRKRLGKHHRERIFEEMRKQQRMFAEQNIENEPGQDAVDEDANMDEGDVENGDSTSLFPSSNCILCRMPDDKTSVFGVMCYIMKSNVSRQVPWSEKDWVYEAYGCNKDLDDDIPDSIYEEIGNDNWKSYRNKFRDEHRIGPGFPSESTSKKMIVTGCGHGIHFQCYREHVNSTVARAAQVNRNTPEDVKLGEYLCPLCKALNNTFVPVLWRNNNYTLHEVMKVNEYGEVEYPEEMDDKNFLTRLKSMSFRGRDEGALQRQALSTFKKLSSRNLLPHFEKAFQDIEGETSDSLEGLAFQLRESMMNPFLQLSFDDQSWGSFGRVSAQIFRIVAWLSNSITDLEISLRGKKHPNAMGGLLLDQIPSQSSQLLRVFTEFTRCYARYAISYYEQSEDFPFVAPYDLLWPGGTSPSPFRDFAMSALITGPCLGLEVPEVLKMSFVSCILQVVTSLASQVNVGGSWMTDPLLFDLPRSPGCDDQNVLTALSNIVGAVRIVVEQDYSSPQTYIWSNSTFGQIVYTMLSRQVLPFLRQAAILVHLLVGSGYDAYNYMGYDKGYEGDKLCDFLGIPHLNDMVINMSTPDTPENYIVKTMIGNNYQKFDSGLDYPGVIRLLHLPHRLDEFFSVSKKDFVEDVPSDPAVCLYCGKTMGVQTPSASDTSLGQCFTHLVECGGRLGMFILPKRSSLLLLNGEQGSFAEGPYLDLHGEPDETMRRGRPQFLHANRYDHFARTQWLQHGLVSYIARRLDSFIDNGGWETL